MNSTKSVGRIVGLLFLLQALLAVPVYTEVGMMRSVIGPAGLMQLTLALWLIVKGFGEAEVADE